MYEPVEAEVDNSQPVPDEAPATGLPFPSFNTLTIVIALPCDSVNTTFEPDSDAVMFVGAAALTSATISAPIPTAIPYAACPAVVVENVTVVPLIVISPPGYTPTSPYAKLNVDVVAVVGDGVVAAVTPCVDVLPLMSDTVCASVVLVSVTAVSLIYITSFAVTVGFKTVPVTDDAIESVIFKNCILPDVELVVNPPAVELSV